MAWRRVCFRGTHRYCTHTHSRMLTAALKINTDQCLTIPILRATKDGSGRIEKGERERGGEEWLNESWREMTQFSLLSIDTGQECTGGEGENWGWKQGKRCKTCLEWELKSRLANIAMYYQGYMVLLWCRMLRAGHSCAPGRAPNRWSCAEWNQQATPRQTDGWMRSDCHVWGAVVSAPDCLARKTFAGRTGETYGAS